MRGHINRRTFLQVGALASISLYSGIVLSGAGSAKNNGSYRFKVGEFECVCISDGGYNYELQQFFNNVPEEQVKQVLRWCPCRKYPNESPETMLGLWKDAAWVLGQVVGKADDATAIQYVESVVTMLEVGEIPDEMRCSYYAYRAWLQLQLVEAVIRMEPLLVEVIRVEQVVGVLDRGRATTRRS